MSVNPGGPRSLDLTRSRALIFDHIYDGVIVTTPDGVISDWNAGAERMFGWSREEVLGLTPAILHRPPDAPGLTDSIIAAATRTGRWVGEITFVRKDGSIGICETVTVPLHDEQGRLELTVGVNRDITERKHAGEKLASERLLLRTLIDAIPDPIFFKDRAGRHLIMNAANCAVFGLSEDAIGKTVFEILPDRDHAELYTADDEAVMTSGQPITNREEPFVGAGGRHGWGLTSKFPLRAANGEITGLIGIVRDITAMKEAAQQAETARVALERKLLETQKLESLGVLAGGIAHDFNNLLSGILGNASLAALDLPAGSPVHDCITQIAEASHRAADLCKQMLDYSGRGRFVVQTVDLGQLVGQMAQMLQISISKKASLLFQLEKDLPPIEADATQVRQVIMNLIINASEAIGDQPGVIRVSTGRHAVDRAYFAGTLMAPDLPEGEYVSLEVSDNGCGMTPETQSRIFDPFFTTKFTGRGLGLAAVLGIVRGHRAAIKVSSELGRGTTFQLLFPVATGGCESPAAAATTAAAWCAKGTVLVVYDEEIMRNTVARMLHKLGLEPVLVSDGLEAIEVFRAQSGRFDLVLLDLTMPHLDGEQTLRELRRLQPQVPVVLMSGFNAREAMVRLTGKGLASFLQKPFTIESLRTLLQKVLG